MHEYIYVYIEREIYMWQSRRCFSVSVSIDIYHIYILYIHTSLCLYTIVHTIVYTHCMCICMSTILYILGVESSVCHLCLQLLGPEGSYLGSRMLVFRAVPWRAAVTPSFSSSASLSASRPDPIPKSASAHRHAHVGRPRFGCRASRAGVRASNWEMLSEDIKPSSF